MALFRCGCQGGDQERFLVGKVVSHHACAAAGLCRDIADRHSLDALRGDRATRSPCHLEALLVTIDKLRHGTTVTFPVIENKCSVYVPLELTSYFCCLLFYYS